MENFFQEALFSDKPRWHMSPTERMAIFGILSLLKPKSVLEIGTNEGGCTKWLCRYSKTVYSVDHVNLIGDMAKKYRNLHFLNMKSEDAFAKLKNQNAKFDLIILDADHSFQGSAADLKNALGFKSVILMHDTYNPTCRAGYESVLNKLDNKDIYYNLDFQKGGLFNNEHWGGLGLVLSKGV